MKMQIVAVTFVSAGVMYAQSVNPLSAEARQVYTSVKNNILRSAEKMPEENYGFKPAPRVRTFGQLLGHVAEEQYIFCSAVRGEQKAADIEKTKSSKADLLAALHESFSYCDAAYDGLTDAAAIERVKVGAVEHTKLRMLWVNTVHDESHYGNIVTYLRIKGLVPPSTEGQ
jgi:uncharacterized damage-inducible protein DinB